MLAGEGFIGIGIDSVFALIRPAEVFQKQLLGNQPGRGNGLRGTSAVQESVISRDGPAGTATCRERQLTAFFWSATEPLRIHTSPEWLYQAVQASLLHATTLGCTIAIARTIMWTAATATMNLFSTPRRVGDIRQTLSQFDIRGSRAMRNSRKAR